MIFGVLNRNKSWENLTAYVRRVMTNVGFCPVSLNVIIIVLNI